MNGRGSGARQVGLLVVVFGATIVLLVGGRALLGRAQSERPVGSAATPGTSGVAVIASPTSPSGSASPDGSGPPTIVLTGAGDIADCTLKGAAQTSDLLIGQAGSIFTAGDNAYEDGSAANFGDCYGPTWGRVKDRTILTAAGNHDWNTDGAAGYLAYFGAAAAPQGVTWYSTDLGAWHVVVLDSDCARVGGCDDASPQGRWLAKDLAASEARCTLAIWHHPRFSSGEHGNDREVAPFWDQLHAAGAELVVNGHDHDYERFAPQDAAGKVERPGGLREIVIGTGGGELRAFHTLAANSEFRQAGTWGVLRLTLHPANYDWEFLPVDSDLADSGSTPCH
ncbi:MAG TPA: metallophosphoesterase [Candidatus Limnocylindrales bacterium]|nr:metallophosphoesterase [Candidatus Limnocylindrales bacterium]